MLVKNFVESKYIVWVMNLTALISSSCANMTPKNTIVCAGQDDCVRRKHQSDKSTTKILYGRRGDNIFLTNTLLQR